MQHLFDKHATVLRVKRTPDGYMGQDETWPTLHPTVPCALRQLSGHERLVGERMTSMSTHRMYCRVVDITTADRVQCNGHNFNVASVDNKRGRFLEVDLELRDDL